MFQSSTLKFLKTLAKNNTKPWFDEHHSDYVDARTDFEKFVSSLIEKTGTFDKDVKELLVKQCVFRINRDIRFAKDKRPYKNNMGASLDRGGKKSMFAGYYFHLEPGNKSFAGGGLWMPMAPELKKVRQEIDYCFIDFQKIISDKKFKTQFGELENTPDVKLTNLPRGYEKDNPAAEYLKLKSFIALKNIKDEDVVKPNLLTETISAFKSLQPLLNFINKSIE